MDLRAEKGTGFAGQHHVMLPVRALATLRRQKPLLRGLLDRDGLRFVEAMAPQTIPLPSGRKMALSYEGGSAPRGRARIQDLFGLSATPAVAGGRVPVLIEILAPNNRPVQITDDLGRFWSVHYPELKKNLSRRYPKHEWR